MLHATFPFPQKWALVSSINNTLAGKRGSAAHFQDIIVQKRYEAHNHEVEISKHAASDTDVFRCL